MTEVLQFPTSVEPYTDTEKYLARRLNASLTSVHMGLRSVDYTLKVYIGEDTELDDSWYQLARVVLRNG